jgi:aldehyde:ferredoxin oxidoreductase
VKQNKPLVVDVPRFGRLKGWVNRILRIDLGEMSVRVHESVPYVPDYLGARGIAHKIAWDEYPEPVEPFAAANPLMVFPGALTGSRAPYAGRTNVCAFSPQGFPHPWFTRSSIGGRFGGELKRAGYDGLVVTGAADVPVRIRIRDDRVSILPAGDLWGLDALDALEALAAVEGKGTYSLTIGPAGEHLSRIATIQTDTSSACGQGGFGAVMGAKRLKAISVAGTGRVEVAAPETIRALARALSQQARPPSWFGEMKAFNRRLAAEGSGRARLRSCTEGCVSPCAVEFRDVPGCAYDRTWSGDWVCIACDFRGTSERTPEGVRASFDWQLELRAAFEMNVLTNRYGLNQFDILTGMVPWLIACQKAGLLSELNGREIDWRSPTFWAAFLHAIAYREGIGDVLAEGGWAAARALHMGEELAACLYPGWGHPTHWDGHNKWNHPFPYWIPALLQWMSDTRDPFSTGHGSLHGMGAARRAWQTDDPAERAAILAEVRAWGERIYGDGRAMDPYSGYEAKAGVGYYHTLRPVIKDCVPVDDQCFPLLWNPEAADGRYVLRDIPSPADGSPADGSPAGGGVRDVDGPDVERLLFVAGTGVDWGEGEFERAVARVHALERALQVRHWARDRAMDESVLPYFEQFEMYANPLLNGPMRLDREAFKPVVDAFYTMHGWDVERGWPTRDRLSELGLSDVHAPMVEGAARARERRAHL